ncbi:NAC domain-containing protein 53-like isoform X2 [Iris pallida]|uniref:NAC domain-containing protein 53-like isoform X2 n=1 Tax=Iris pallida TaxID=29817 RepID=A0AAX6EAP5_IRIPA|nr:NAC domain-containing protein 53-like isoform X2 [Iris pallida]
MAKTSLPPGFRFHPTDVELVWYYLKRRIMGKPFHFEAIAEVELYKFAPWDLPVKSCLRSRDLEWYFFCPRDRKYANGTRANRATDNGYWKTTGKDRTIVYNSRTVGMKKTLIFHLGKAPHGTRTDWVMYEFRLESVDLVNAEFSQDAFVVCKIFQKSGPGPKNGEQYGAPFVEEDWDDITDNDHAVALPCFPCQEPSYDCPSLSNPVPFQFVHFEVGEPSSTPYLSEAGPLSAAIPAQSVTSEVGEPSSMLAPSQVGWLPSIPELSYADGILLEQLEEFLNTSPPHHHNSSGKMLVSPILNEDVDGMLNEDTHAVYGQLDEVSHQPGIGLDDFFS